MSINIKDDITKHLNNLINFDYEKQLDLMGVDAIEIINDRAEKRVDVNGKSFPELSPKYKKSKIESGRKGVRDLQFSGEMLNSMQYNVSGNVLLIDFPTRDHKKSKERVDEIAEKNNNVAPFFDLNKKELDELSKEYIIKPLEKLFK